jgi:hypothetical protein
MFSTGSDSAGKSPPSRASEPDPTQTVVVEAVKGDRARRWPDVRGSQLINEMNGTME